MYYAFLGAYILYAVCPFNTLDPVCHGLRESNMPMYQYPRYELCDADRVMFSQMYPHIIFQCTRDYIGEVKWGY